MHQNHQDLEFKMIYLQKFGCFPLNLPPSILNPYLQPSIIYLRSFVYGY
jgi:hypothetical protein